MSFHDYPREFFTGDDADLALDHIEHLMAEALEVFDYPLIGALASQAETLRIATNAARREDLILDGLAADAWETE